MIVNNQPDAIDSSEARCPTHPQVGDVTASQRAFHVGEAMRSSRPQENDLGLQRGFVLCQRWPMACRNEKYQPERATDSSRPRRSLTRLDRHWDSSLIASYHLTRRSSATAGDSELPYLPSTFSFQISTFSRRPAVSWSDWLGVSLQFTAARAYG